MVHICIGIKIPTVFKDFKVTHSYTSNVLTVNVQMNNVNAAKTCNNVLPFLIVLDNSMFFIELLIPKDSAA